MKTLDGTWLEKRGKKKPKQQINEQTIVPWTTAPLRSLLGHG
jgi:hypothetical protein